jgi:hypothetical protein
MIGVERCVCGFMNERLFEDSVGHVQISLTGVDEQVVVASAELPNSRMYPDGSSAVATVEQCSC